jgi:hypothetical protein
MPTDEPKPACLTDDMLNYLDDLRESGITNMFGAAPYLREAYNLNRDESSDVLEYWMRTFKE